VFVGWFVCSFVGVFVMCSLAYNRLHAVAGGRECGRRAALRAGGVVRA